LGVAISQEDEESKNEGSFEVVAPQNYLFELKLFNSSTTTGIETRFNMNSLSVRFVDWTTCEQAVARNGSDVKSEDG
jgi:hypothetical protein